MSLGISCNLDIAPSNQDHNATSIHAANLGIIRGYSGLKADLLVSEDR